MKSPIFQNCPFVEFRESLEKPDRIDLIREGLIGEGVEIQGLDGPKPLVYADYVASGRALTMIEDFVRESVLPYYSNSHTDASFCGAYITELRTRAREIIRSACGATIGYSVVFTGSGATSGLNRLVHLFGVHKAVAQGKIPLVLLGPYEHHSNILPWRESGAEVIELEECNAGGPDLVQLEGILRNTHGRLVIGAFNAASNVTGIVTNTTEVTRLLKHYDAKVVWDFAGAGPYLPINAVIDESCKMDALVISAHKFIGGPGASGVLLVRPTAVEASIPTVPGGGTVKFVSPWNHDYSDCLVSKEEAGTPNVIGDIRAALAFIVKDVIGDKYHAQRLEAHYESAIDTWGRVSEIEILGNPGAKHRLPIFSLRIRNPNQNDYVHQQLFTRMLSDVYGIQARGGCACAGPYAHRMLGITRERSDEIRAAIKRGDEIQKPGWTRLNISVLMTDAKARYIVDSVAELAKHSERYMKFYRCDETNARFQLRDVA